MHLEQCRTQPQAAATQGQPAPAQSSCGAMKDQANPGLSFADITAAAVQHPHTTRTDPSQLPAAGVCTGAGREKRTQQAGSLWGGADPASKLMDRTEARSQYKPPPPGALQPQVKPPVSQIVTPDYPPVLKSVSHADYHPDVLLRAGPPCRGSKLKDSGSPLPTSTGTPQFMTQTGITFQAHSQDEWKAANSRAAGCPATCIVSYNIIHGAPAASNPYEAWRPGHDYRRTRPAS